MILVVAASHDKRRGVLFWGPGQVTSQRASSMLLSHEFVPKNFSWGNKKLPSEVERQTYWGQGQLTHQPTYYWPPDECLPRRGNGWPRTQGKGCQI